MTGVFSNQAIHDAIQRELAENPLPADKHAALIAHAEVHNDGSRDVSVVTAERIGEHWTISEDAELHHDQLAQQLCAGVNVIASW